MLSLPLLVYYDLFVRYVLRVAFATNSLWSAFRNRWTTDKTSNHDVADDNDIDVDGDEIDHPVAGSRVRAGVERVRKTMASYCSRRHLLKRPKCQNPHILVHRSLLIPSLSFSRANEREREREIIR